MAEHKGCPVCHNTAYYNVYVSGNGESYLYSTKGGEVTLNVCTECGCVYIEEPEGVR